LFKKYALHKYTSPFGSIGWLRAARKLPWRTPRI
jgi:hypothetical protein